jgi:DNA-directed RNA polymerase specialized sigma24 family protein
MWRRERASGARLDEIERIYAARYPAFLRTATAMVGDPDAAHDVVQEAFATVVRRRQDYRREGSLEGWIWRIVVNQARAVRRARRPAPAGDIEPTWNGGHHDPDDAGARIALAELPERQRLVVFLRYFADLDHRSIAEALEIRPGTVAATLNAAHAALRRRLQEVSP